MTFLWIQQVLPENIKTINYLFTLIHLYDYDHSFATKLLDHSS